MIYFVFVLRWFLQLVVHNNVLPVTCFLGLNRHGKSSMTGLCTAVILTWLVVLW